jgi:hypothetical protein
MENKKTAVDWLFTKQDLEDFDTLMLYKIAKQMEKEQIIDAHLNAYVEMNMSFRGADRAEQYYNETYDN